MDPTQRTPLAWISFDESTKPNVIKDVIEGTKNCASYVNETNSNRTNSFTQIARRTLNFSMTSNEGREDEDSLASEVSSSSNSEEIAYDEDSDDEDSLALGLLTSSSETSEEEASDKSICLPEDLLNLVFHNSLDESLKQLVNRGLVSKHFNKLSAELFFQKIIDYALGSIDIKQSGFTSLIQIQKFIQAHVNQKDIFIQKIIDQKVTNFLCLGFYSTESFVKYFDTRVKEIELLNLTKNVMFPESLIPQPINSAYLQLYAAEFLNLPEDLANIIIESKTCISLINFDTTNLLLLNRLENFPKIELSFVISQEVANLRELSKLKNITRLSFPSANDSMIISLPLFKNLTTLHVSGRGITQLTWLSRIKNLRELKLSLCTIGDISPLSELEKLEALNLFFCNDVCKTKFGQLKSLQNLKYLSLEKCAINPIYAQLNELKKLMYLNLAHSNPKKLNNFLKNLSQLEHLENLNLTASYIEDQDLDDLPKNICKLNLSKCYSITANGIAKLSQLKYLTDLDLSNCHSITDDAIVHLKSLENLKNLNLTMTKITPQAIMELPEKLTVIKEQ
jgi:hypothetical protein